MRSSGSESRDVINTMQPRSARGDGAARVTKWRAVPLGSTTRPNIEGRRSSQLGDRQRLKIVPRRGTSTATV